MDKLIRLKEILEKNRAYQHAMTILSWDLETEAPVNAALSISKTLGALFELSYLTLVNDEVRDIVYGVDINTLNEIDKKLILNLRKNIFDKMSKIPVDVYSKYSELGTMSTQKWGEAKRTNNLEIYAPYLEEVIKYNKDFIKYRGYEGHPYNLLLSDYENELTVEIVDEFFKNIKDELTPFIKEVITKKREELKDIKARFLSKPYPIDKQKELSKEISEILKYDYNSGVIKESEHPFTTSTSNKDVRITTHYYENDPLSAIYSTIHETGHALYEQQISDEYQDNFLGNGVSMGIHESQSRIFENMFCKNDSFTKVIYDLLDKYFGVEITLDEFKLLLNEVNTSLIRVEADELTYPIHVMIRYELEKEIFSDLEKMENAEEIAKKWADKYEEYLGVSPKTYSEGILQDVHWSQGSFGYFSSYALGSAYSAQIYKAMEKDVDINKDLADSNFENINNWLKEKIHKFGSFKDPKDVILNATGEEFNSKYYVDYLKNKFAKIYGVEVK
ncbi:carboxypeptidase M32 [Streptobacillus felis]|uniref:Metal-dependent carboxypeptidase n=1 Tax=Streptobacillus felis TaxID=1384509 RepID=A0A7Z0PEI1_9FUSO|nr:carboxypeptidase M32 [Streptobacillus felis]NYV27569.1 carboxypeptidase M32 [Streptobacillus felis]